MQLKFITWNIRGVSSQTKKNKVLNYLDNLQADAVYVYYKKHTFQIQNKTP